MVIAPRSSPSSWGVRLPEWAFAMLCLLGLATFAVAQGVYEMLGRNEEFLQVRLRDPYQLVLLVLLFNLLPPLILFVVWAGCRRVGARVAAVWLRVAVFLLCLVFFLQLYNAYMIVWFDNIENAYLLAFIPAGLVVWSSVRFRTAFATFIILLSPTIVLFPVLFLLGNWGAGAKRPTVQPSRTNISTPERTVDDKPLPPVFLIVFDELSALALMDENGNIRGDLFPHFKRLAGESYWFRNATANASDTLQSIPIILTGNWPEAGRSPTFSSYPENLLALFRARGYEVYSFEGSTQFCIPATFHCLKKATARPADNFELAWDVFYLFAVRVVPRGTAFPLPNVRGDWGGFRDITSLVQSRVNELGEFEQAVVSLDGNSLPFFFFQPSLPHAPYVLTPRGQIIASEPFYFSPAQRGNTRQLTEVRAKYEKQIVFVDAQLGRWLDLLRDKSLYDRSLIVVTADHGVSSMASGPGRKFAEVDGRIVNAHAILAVPLLVKLPFQKERVISDRDAQLVDLAPTIVDATDFSLPWPAKGHSLIRQGAPPRNRVAFDSRFQRFEFSSHLTHLAATEMPRARWTADDETPNGTN